MNAWGIVGLGVLGIFLAVVALGIFYGAKVTDILTGHTGHNDEQPPLTPFS